MALHRLLGIEIGVPEPDVLDAFYREIGFVGEARRWGPEGSPRGEPDLVSVISLFISV